jgi:SAM-dependent methyltransferase
MSDTNSPSFWESMYQSGRTGWNLGQPTPVFARLADSLELELGKMLVLCAGHGHDARMFASRGFEVTAVDFASEAVQAMHALDEPQAPLEILQLDLFELPAFMDGQFDYVLEYTCFCAIDPQRRAEYVKRVTDLLKPGGFYIALAFPIREHPGGPPYSVSSDELVQPFIHRGFELLHREIPSESVPGRRGIEELIILRKKTSE